MNPNNTPISFCVAEKTPDNAVECEGAAKRKGLRVAGQTNRQTDEQTGSS